MQNDLIKQSIADAKALRQSAYELAKEQIAESFGPRVQEMIRLKLSEMEDESVDEAKEKELDEMKDKEDELAEGMDDLQTEGDEEDMVDEATLDQMLAELEGDEDEEPVEESAMSGFKTVGKSSKNSMKEADGDDEEEAEEPAEEGGEEESMEGGEGEEVTELTVDELKDIIRSVVSDVMGGGAQAGAEGGEGEEIDLGSAGAEGGEEESEEEMQEITLDEILASLEEEDRDVLQEKKGAKKPAKKEDEKEEKSKKELKEAVQTIKALQRELNEVNLLNAKLLYVNKLFKGAALNESQKLSVITAFDRAETVREAKKIYETLKDSLIASKPAVKKNSLKESVGFASKASGIVPRQQKPIVEQDNIVNRWQVLAGIKKVN